ISGALPNLPFGQLFANKVFSVDAGGAKAAFTLDPLGKARGLAPNGKSSMKLTFVKRSKPLVFAGGNVPFTARFKGTFSGADAWNIDRSAQASKTPLSLTVLVTFDGATYTASASTLLTSKMFKGGSFKLLPPP